MAEREMKMAKKNLGEPLGKPRLKKKAKQKLGPNQRKWLKALESGKFKQGKGALKRPNNSYCCLGVACEIFKPASMEAVSDGDAVSFNGYISFPPEIIWQSLALYANDGSAGKGAASPLFRLNDDGKRFKAIAALIRKDPSVYFKRTK